MPITDFSIQQASPLQGLGMVQQGLQAKGKAANQKALMGGLLQAVRTSPQAAQAYLEQNPEAVPMVQQAMQARQAMNPQVKGVVVDKKLRNPITGEIIGDYGEGSRGEVGTVSPKDFTVESMAAYEKSGNIEDLVRYKPKTFESGGVTFMWDESQGKYAPAVDLRSSNISDQAAASAQLEADKQSRLDFSKRRSEFLGNKPKYINNISAAEDKQKVIQDTIGKLKTLMSGWNTKYGAILSNLPASEARTMRGLIDTIKANSAFTTLTDLKAAGGTLGAISEAELNLLERAWGALDQGGESSEFVRVLDQLERQNSASTERMRNALDMDMLNYAGSYEDFERRNRAKQTGIEAQEETTVTPEGVETQTTVNWADL